MIKKGTAKVHIQYVGGGASSSSLNYGSSNNSYGNSSGSSVTPQYVPSSTPIQNETYTPNVIYTPKDSQSVSDALASVSGAGIGAGSALGASESFGNSTNYADVPLYPETSTTPTTPIYPDNTSTAIPPVTTTPNYDVPVYPGGNATIIPESSYDNLSPNTVVGQLYLHLAVFKDRATAQRLSMELRRRNIINAIFSDNGFFAVQAGPYQNKTQVLKVKQYLHSKFPQSYLVIR